MTQSLFHFALTKKQALAVIDVVSGIDCSAPLPRKHPLTTVANALDEQMAQQERAWEKCENCGGSGWVEE